MLLAMHVHYNLFPMWCGTPYAFQNTFALPSMPYGGVLTGVLRTERTQVVLGSKHNELYQTK